MLLLERCAPVSCNVSIDSIRMFYKYSATGWVSQIVCNICPHLRSLTCCLPLSQGPYPRALFRKDFCRSPSVLYSHVLPILPCVSKVYVACLISEVEWHLKTGNPSSQTPDLCCMSQLFYMKDGCERCDASWALWWEVRKRRHRKKVLQNENVLWKQFCATSEPRLMRSG